MTADRCRSCQSPIIWALTTAGKNMPVNLEHDPRGNIVLIRAPDGTKPKAMVPKPGEWPHLPRRTSHFVNCPHAAEHRN